MARRDGRTATNRDAKGARCIDLTNKVYDREELSVDLAPAYPNPKSGWRSRMYEAWVELGSSFKVLGAQLGGP
jgi:hypothetical protein